MANCCAITPLMECPTITTGPSFFSRMNAATSSAKSIGKNLIFNKIRLDLGQILILGLEFIVAADLIGTTTTPDYYAVGILAIIVGIRTLLSYSLTREMSHIQSRVKSLP